MTPLCTAAFHERKNVVETLLRRGAQIEKTATLHDTPLTLAAGKGKTEIVEILLQHGANLEHHEMTGKTALSQAVSRGQLDICVVLLERGADIEAKDNDGKAPLHLAAKNGHLHVVKLLLEQGANVNTCDNQGRTPITCHFLRGAFILYGVPAETKLEITKLLISYGAEVTNEIESKIIAQFPDYSPQIEAALLFERQRRTLLEHTSIPVEVTNLFFSFQECYENQKCCKCSTTIRHLLTPELIRVCDTSPLHRICTDCDQKRQECNDHTCPVCSNCAQQKTI